MRKKRHHNTKPHDILKQAQDWCDQEDKSTEFMIAYMTDQLTWVFPHIDNDQAHDMVMDHLSTQAEQWWGDSIVYMPTSFYDLRKIEAVGYKEAEDNLSQHYSWVAIDLDTKTYRAVVGMQPSSVIVSANTINILEVLRGMNREGEAWMKYGRDYIFSNSYYPAVLDVKKRLKGIREGINE